MGMGEFARLISELYDWTDGVRPPCATYNDVCDAGKEKVVMAWMRRTPACPCAGRSKRSRNIHGLWSLWSLCSTTNVLPSFS